jgi:hypothetical protein
MTITELIANLEQLKAVHGDIKVSYYDTDRGVTSDINCAEPRYPYKAGQWGSAANRIDLTVD